MEIDWRFEPSGDFRAYDLGILGPRPKRRPNECSIKTRFGSPSARLIAHVARTTRAASESTTINLEVRSRCKELPLKRTNIPPARCALASLAGASEDRRSWDGELGRDLGG